MTTSSPETSSPSGSSSVASSAASATSPARSTESSQKLREMVMLPKDFEPSETDVVIGRGKKARTHDGNTRLRGLIEFMIPDYSAAGSNKDEKSYIIKEIVTQIRKSSPDGGFVKFDKPKNRWFEVGDFLAREKISQTFRDAMGDAYSSSNPYKRKRRSFEKKHNAIMDIIKRRRGSSPTSVLQSGVATPPSPPSPAPTTTAVDPSMALAPPSVSPSPPASPARHNPALMNMFKRPGQIGFARRSMMQFGMPGPVGMPMHPSAMRGMPIMHMGPMPGMVPLHHPIPHPGMAMPPRRVSMPGAPYNPAMMADIMMNQRMARSVRRTSAPHSTL